MILASPRWVKATSEVVWDYLRCTAEQGLWFLKETGENWEEGSPAGLETYSDISYSPDGEISHGAVYVTWNKGLLFWRSSRQPYPTMSTAESELTEAIEAFCVGDSIDCLVLEHEPPHAKRLLVDNAAAISLLQDGATSWRTRHLKIRSRCLRWRVSSLDWKINFIPGLYQVADVGTKPVVGQRLEALKSLMNMGGPPTEKREVRNAEEEKTVSTEALVGGSMIAEMKMALVMGLLAAQIREAAAADPTDEGSTERVDFERVLKWGFVLYTLLVVGLTLIGRCLFDAIMRKFMSYLGRDEENADVAEERVSEMREDSTKSAQGGVRLRGAMERRNRLPRTPAGEPRADEPRRDPGALRDAGRDHRDDLRHGDEPRRDAGDHDGAEDHHGADHQRGSGHQRDSEGRRGESEYEEYSRTTETESGERETGDEGRRGSTDENETSASTVQPPGRSPSFSPVSPWIPADGRQRPAPYNVFGPQVGRPQRDDRPGGGVEPLAPPVVVFLAPRSGQKYHTTCQCQGLQRANAVRSAGNAWMDRSWDSRSMASTRASSMLLDGMQRRHPETEHELKSTDDVRSAVRGLELHFDDPGTHSNRGGV